MKIRDYREIGTMVGSPKLGHFYFYSYDPKLKDLLPYYDRFPFCLIVNPYTDGFGGLNLHYMPRQQRRVIMDKLIAINGTAHYTQRKKIVTTYQYLKSLLQYKNIQLLYKRYLFTHCRSQFLEVKPSKWKVMADLNVAAWSKGKPY